MIVQTTGHIYWDSATVEPLNQTPDGPIIEQITVSSTYAGPLIGASTQALLVTYHDADAKSRGTGTWTGMELFTGEIDGRRGSIAFRESGRFDNRSRSEDFRWEGTWETDPDSGTGDLAGWEASGSLRLFHHPPNGEYTIDHRP